MSATPEQLQKKAHLFGGNAAYLEAAYEEYLDHPQGIPEHWRRFFDSLHNGAAQDIPQAPIMEQFRHWQRGPGMAGDTLSPAMFAKQSSVSNLINAYRVRGHQQADLNPLDTAARPDTPDLHLSFHQLDDSDLDTVFHTGSLAADDRMSLRGILDLLKKVYCTHIGYEFMHITDTRQRTWLFERLERAQGDFGFTSEDKQRIFSHMVAAEGLERYLHTRYVGQKRFSLEGGDSLIPLLHQLARRGGATGAQEIVIGMAHRGRLNVLINVLGKSPSELFDEFEGKIDPDTLASSGDAKYHLGYSSNVPTPGGPLHLALSFNPSHLEIIDPVVGGSVRARQVRRGDVGGEAVMPVLVHGDGAFAGQGVVMETFNMSQARGFYVGGTVHVIINNQIGFTLSNPVDARSTLYCSEVAKMVQAPIFHVNGDHPDAVAYATELACDFRREFEKDVLIDLVCYRRHGHNEADEPAATQPLMYQAIRSFKTPMQHYAEQLEAEGVLTAEEVRKQVDHYRDCMDAGTRVVELSKQSAPGYTHVDWARYDQRDWDQPVKTGLSDRRFKKLAAHLYALPEKLKLQARVRRVIDDRKKMAAGELRMDWGFAESLAYASLLQQGFPVRLVGQDSGRGTFFHRHAELHDQKTGEVYVPLEQAGKNASDFIVINSLLSEEAVLGFEYGYSTADPTTLTIWEAQFGDFANGAQVVIDQFISSGEAKWGRLCGLTLLLPHGYEGQGPEHSSARLERYLQLCAEQNMQVCVPTTPAQMFHMLCRQSMRDYRKPLIVMTPKSMLRLKQSTSSIADITHGTFQPVIGEHRKLSADKVRKIICCTGKVYYDLLAEAEKNKIKDCAILRVEQLYPFPDEYLLRELEQYPKARTLVWCQEEPRNQGAWFPIRHDLEACCGKEMKLEYAGRAVSASPAVGYHATHVEQQQQLVREALRGAPKQSKHK